MKIKNLASVSATALLLPPIGYEGAGLKSVMDKQDEIPEGYRDLYTEKNGKWELTGVTGVKSEADVVRINTALTKERDEHKKTKERLGAWGELDAEQTIAKLDRFPELEAAAKGKLDEAQIEDIVSKRVEGTIKSKLSPIERQLKQAQEGLIAVTQERDALAGEKRSRTITDHVRVALTEAKVLPEAQEDALMLAERMFEIAEDGKVITRDGVGVTPGATAKDWLAEMLPKRPHWIPANSAGGTKLGTGGLSGENPWAADTWNSTKQGKIVSEKGMEFAERLAKAAGTKVGGLKPVVRKT